ncbi:ABC transporter permease [Amycolatopsis endophytica]|uniref:ABC-type nitrate/sulfonate/bicarbonate transport system permease component n=1 Tax=Amycolatopsis endophytica TaxID=860233 RepID=A0A853AXD8_9PSEU|nr:ABC transporter permease [Amycolatopsis endophytica]NYI87350.1 ABC-type nitrate/sulfonate/bicarbonate transport system permease component [Amycolatopsis endophytica]
MSLRSVAKQIAFALALPVILVIVWWFASAGSENYFWPPLTDIVEAFGETWTADKWTGDVLPSLGNLLAGYLLALVVGVLAGTVIGLSRTVRALCEPVLEFFRAIPPPVLVPIIALFTGFTGVVPKIVTITLGCLWPILLNTVEGVRGLDEVLLDTARSYRFRARTRLVRVVMHGASPQIAAGARQALSIGVILMVISELFGANRGLGASIVQFQRSFAIPQMWTGIILLGLLGVVLSVLFRVVEHRALAWYRGLRRAEKEN